RPPDRLTARPPSLRSLQRDAERVPRIEAVPQPADELADALAVGAEVTQNAAECPRRPLQGHRDLARGGQPAESAEALHRGVAGPADHPGAGARAHQSLVEVVGQEVD